MAVVRQDGRIVAFANLWPGAAGGELSIDRMRHLCDAPRGVTDFLFVSLMGWGRDHGYSGFSFGMTPLEIRLLTARFDHLLGRQWQRLLDIQQIQTELMEEVATHRQTVERRE